MANDEMAEIYQALKQGTGHERVTDGNVDQLIRLAMERGDTQLEVLLREWRTPCGIDRAMPALEPALPGARR